MVTLAKPKSSPAVNAAEIGGGAVIGALLGIPADKSRGAVIGAGVGLGIGTGAVLLQKGHEARIKSDEEISILLNRKVTLPAEDF